MNCSRRVHHTIEKGLRTPPEEIVNFRIEVTKLFFGEQAKV